MLSKGLPLALCQFLLEPEDAQAQDGRAEQEQGEGLGPEVGRARPLEKDPPKDNEEIL